MPVDFAQAVLADLVAVQGAGLAAVLPFAPETSWAYAVHRHRGTDWQQGFAMGDAWKKDRDALWERVLGPAPELEALMGLEATVATDRTVPGETTAFGTRPVGSSSRCSTRAVADVVRPAFDVCGPLPSGTTVLEASAGTGKTFALAALTARYVAEADRPLRSLLLVTFGRMATTELRSRVRERLVTLLAALTAGAPRTTTGWPRCSAPSTRPSGSARRHRVAAALRDIDEATIATTHEFCLQMLESLGVLGDAEPEARFVEQVDDLVDEVASDLYLQRYAGDGATPTSLTEAQTLGRRACASATARLVPDPVAEPSGPDRARRNAEVAAERVAFARAVRVEVERRMRAARLFTYDDMLTRLAGSLRDPERGPAAVARLRARYGVVLVDEFQDTDPVQWDILRTAFAGHTTMVLIGDPKQAIYGFRGADVHCYLDARGSPARRSRPCPRTTGATPGSSPPSTPCSAGPRSASGASSWSRSRPPSRGRGWRATRRSSPRSGCASGRPARATTPPCGCRRSGAGCATTWCPTSSACSAPRSPSSGTTGAGPPGSSPATSRCSSGPTRRRRTSGRGWSTPASRPSCTRPGRSSPPRPRRTGSPC